MRLDLTNEINSMIEDRKMNEEQVLSLVRDMITSAYKRKYGTDENCVIEFDDTNRVLSVYQVRTIVAEEDWYNPNTEIDLQAAMDQLEGDNFQIGDQVKIPLNPKNFEASSIQSAKQRGQQIVKEYYNDKLYADAKSKEGKLIYGEVKRQRENGDFGININMEIEGSFPVRAQSPIESYQVQSKYKFLVERVEKADSANGENQNQGRRGKGARGVRIYLTRASKDFVRALIENEVPEISTGDVEIMSIARQPGQRTKVAVDTKRSDIDPVGAVVGSKGSRIQTVMAECEGEKIDVIRYSDDPLKFVAQALVPATVQRIVMIDPASKHIIAIVDDSQLGIAIGKGGVNVKLAKMLCDWNIEVKTQAQFAEMEETQNIYNRVDELFKDSEGEEEAEETVLDEIPTLTNEELGIEDGETPITDLGFDDALVEKLHERDIWSIEEFFEYETDELKELGFTDEEIETVSNSVEIEEDETFECPNCHHICPAGTTVCPECGVEFEFEEE